MMTFDEMIASVDVLQAADLNRWVEARWVMPLLEGEIYHFSATDCARVRFICDMRYDYRLEEDAIPLLLSLLDQVYDLRRQLKAVSRAVEAQPDDVRRAVAAALDGGRDS